MANDRLWLACTDCNRAVLLWKHFPTSEGSMYSDEPELTAFMREHLDEHGRGYAMTWGDEPPFETLTESGYLRRDIVGWRTPRTADG